MMGIKVAGGEEMGEEEAWDLEGIMVPDIQLMLIVVVSM